MPTSPLGFIQASPNSKDPSTALAAIKARQAARLNPRFVVASQKPFPGADPGEGASVVRITPARYGGTIGGLLRTPESDRQRIVDAAIDTQQMIDKRFARGASHVVLDEIRGDTSLVAQELFKRLPPSERGKLAAFVVGGAGVNYHHNPTLDAVWHGMARNRVAALPETYGGANLKPGAQMLAAAKDALDKVKFLRSKGIVASPAVSPLDQYHGVGEAGNRHAVQWVNTLRGVMPNTPLSEWAIGGTKNQPLPGRRMLAAILRDRTP